jgi:hypothetical protein
MKKTHSSHAARRNHENSDPAEGIKKAKRTGSLRTLGIFCIVVGFILIVSLSYRMLLLVKQSRFDGKSGFILAMTEDGYKNSVIYGFDPAQKTLSLLELKSSVGMSEPGKLLHTPIDGTLHKKRISGLSDFPLELSTYTLYTQQKDTDVSVLDVIRFWLLAKSIGKSEIKREQIVLPEDRTHIESRLQTFFSDSQLEDDKRTITIINGTAISGLGGRLEKYLSQIGGSVISISTSHTAIPRSKIIYYGEKSYTVSRLEKILRFPLERREGAFLSDIIIEVGEDQQRTTLF